MITKYFKEGLKSLKEGMTVFTCIYDDDGNLLSGIPEPFRRFKVEEITEEQYNEIKRQIDDPSVEKGLADGLINEKGKADMVKFFQEQKDGWRELNEPRIQFVIKKIKKQLELGIIEQDDIDTEIELNNLKEFTEEIKKRLAS